MVTVNLARDYKAELLGEETVSDGQRVMRRSHKLDLSAASADVTYHRARAHGTVRIAFPSYLDGRKIGHMQTGRRVDDGRVINSRLLELTLERNGRTATACLTAEIT